MVSQGENTQIYSSDNADELNFLCDQFSELAFILDVRGEILYANQVAADTLKYCQKELRGMNMISLVDPRQAGIYRDMTDRALGGQPTCSDIDLMARNGDTIHTTTRLIPNTRDRERKICVVSRDITGEIHAEMSRKHLEEMFFKAFQTNPSLMSISSFEENKYVSVNDSFLEKLGYNREEIVGKTSSDIQLFTDIVQSDKFLKKIHSLGKVRDFEISFRTSQGKIRKGLFSAETILLQGEPYLLSVIHDVTEIRKVRENLEQTEVRYKEILEHMSNCVMVFEALEGGMDFRLIEFNPAAEKAEKVTREEVIGMKICDAFPEACSNGIVECLKNVYRSGRSQKYLLNFKDRSGIQQWRQNFVYRLPSSEVVTIYSDITEKRKKEESLIESEQRFRELAEMLPLIVAEADLRGKVTFANRHALHQTRYTAKDIEKGFSVFDLFLPEDARSAQKLLLERIAGKKPVTQAEYNIIRKDGTTFPVTIYLNLIYKDRMPVGFRGVAVDITQSKLDRESIEVEKTYFEQLIENAPEAIVLNDVNGNVMRVNPEFCRLFGYKREEVLSRELDKLITDKKTYQEASDITKQIAGGKRIETESVRKRKDGSYIDVSIMGTPIIFNEKLVGVYGIYRDISERKKAERVQNLVHQISNAVITTKDLAELSQVIKTELGKVMDTTNFFIALYNKEDDSLSLPFFRDEKDNFDSIPAGKTITAYVIRTQNPVLLDLTDMNRLEEEGEIDLVGSNSKVWLGVPLRAREEVIGVISVQSYTNENAFSQEDLEILEFVANQVGISIQWKKAEEALSASMERYRAVAETAFAGITITDLEENLIYMNKTFADMLGYSIGELTGKNLSVLASSEIYDTFREYTNQRRKGEKSQYETVLSRKDGQQIQVLVSASPLMDENRNYSSTLAVVLDITRLKEIQQELILAKDQAEEAARAKQQFLSTMSHEIRTPMNAVIGMTYLLLQEDPRPDQEENLNSLKFSAENLLALINDVLDYSKIEAGKVVFEQIDFNIRELVQGIKQTFVFKAVEKNIGLSVTLDEEIPDILIGDPVRLNQILNNLLSNAIKFTEKGEVSLALTRDTGSRQEAGIRFEVKDTGIGIESGKLDTIFESFTQASNDTSRIYGGTGLGLAISKQLLNLNNSELLVSSKPGTGSVFSFTMSFPVSKLKELRAAETLSGMKFSKLRSKKILLVEDNKMNQIVATKFLQKWEAEVDLAVNGREAIEMVRKKDYDLVLMDLQMPVMNGFDAAAFIRSEIAGGDSIPIMAMTASIVSEVQSRILDSGMNDFIMKPFHPSELYLKLVKNLKKE